MEGKPPRHTQFMPAKLACLNGWAIRSAAVPVCGVRQMDHLHRRGRIKKERGEKIDRFPRETK